jgi:hypothetical protein
MVLTVTGSSEDPYMVTDYLTVTGFSDNPFFSLRDTVFSENPVTAGAAAVHMNLHSRSMRGNIAAKPMGA